jgi:Domain of unknown function (DUF4440)
MSTDLQWLHDTNARIPAAETAGDRAFFEPLLAPLFAIRRGSGKIEGRDDFLAAVKLSEKRTTEILSIELVGDNRAVVTSIVTMETAEGSKRFHNLRLFVREAPTGSWLLLAWANEQTG